MPTDLAKQEPDSILFTDDKAQKQERSKHD